MKFFEAVVKAREKAKLIENTCYDCSYLLFKGKETNLRVFANDTISCCDTIDVNDLLIDEWDAE